MRIGGSRAPRAMYQSTREEEEALKQQEGRQLLYKPPAGLRAALKVRLHIVESRL